MDRAIIHVDMDAFYASVEQRDQPALRGKPVIVGGHPTRGVVLAASYEVRPFGVRSAMPMSRAVRLAPQAVVVPPRFEAYAEASEEVFRIFERYTPLVEPLSLDEAFLDVTASVSLFGPPAQMARDIRRLIRETTRLPSSAGIAPVKFVSKIASDLAKPDGQREVTSSELGSFLAALPVWRLWGVGPRSQEVLEGMGLRTVGDIARLDRAFLEEKLGASGLHLHALSHGLDDRDVVPDRGARSIGAEDTFEHDLRGMDALSPWVHAQAIRVARRLRRHGLLTRVVQLKIKRADFKVFTRRRTLDAPTDDGKVLYETARTLLAESIGRDAWRLTGVSAQEVKEGGGQMSLLEPGRQKRERLNHALDRITQKYGSASVTTADLAGRHDRDDEELRRRGGGSRLDPGDG